jgi:hypothetical protein
MTNQLIDAVDGMLNKAVDDDERESINNEERGCGHLDPNACYIRSDLSVLGAPDGEIPPFVEFDHPIEYREHTGRGAIIPGFKAFPGNSFLKHYRADGRTTTPAGDIGDHFDRLDRVGFDGDHYADMTSTRSIDVLMSVGVSNYDTAEDYIDECRDRGLNLKIPISGNQEPPVIEPLRTRVFVIHPNGCGDGRPGIIGYAYAVRNVFTSGTEADAEDPDVPKWAENYSKTRRDFDIVDRGEPVPADGDVDDAQTTIDAVSVQASDEDGRDVEEVPEDERDPKGSTAEHGQDGDYYVDYDGRDGYAGPYDTYVAAQQARGSTEGATVYHESDVDVDDGDDDTDDVQQDDDGLSGSQVVDLKQVDYNVLKAWSSKHDDVDLGRSPSKDELVEAAREHGVDAATVTDTP